MAKFCPMKRDVKFNNVVFGMCDKDKCEWWSVFFKECSVTSIGFIGFELMKMRTPNEEAD